MAGGDSGPAIVPGKSAESRLIRYVAGLDEDNTMPPEGAGDPLSPRRSGSSAPGSIREPGGPRRPQARAPAGEHWSFRPPRRPALPAVKNAGWPRNPIDHFVLARLEKEGLSPSPEADRATLIRRLSLDLTGLPPTIAEVDAFLADHASRRLRAAGRPAARLASLRRMLGPPLARSRPLRRHQRLREGPRALDLALPRLGHPGPQPRHAVRPLHHRADRRRPAPGRHARPAHRHRLPSQHDDQRGRRHRRRGVPLRRDRRSGQTPPGPSGSA